MTVHPRQQTEGNKLQLTAKVELISFENEKDSWDLDEAEKLAAAAAKKEDGNAKFKAGDIARAMRRYEAAKACLASDYKMDEKQKEECKAGLDEGPLSFCIPTFSFIWRIPIRGKY